MSKRQFGIGDLVSFLAGGRERFGRVISVREDTYSVRTLSDGENWSVLGWELQAA